MRYNAIRSILFTVSVFTAVMLGAGAAHATPHDDWCDTKQQYLINLCNAYYLNDRSDNLKYLQACYATVNRWYADCRRSQDAYPDDPCLSGTVPSRPDQFTPACGTATF
ncbi:hypothetical protein ACFXHA_40885 [Nocardia sp. NPDC059240]|uniref:hypothetical protein n=1 Tax=Nocardia sp. NPDC059240 TaxID=3346786 RepID=UPI0036942D99